MLKEILSNFSEDDLFSYINKSTIKFAIETSPHSSEDNEINKHKLAAVVANNKQIDFILDKKLRDKLIDRFTPSILVSLFPEFNIDPESVTPNHYEAITKWADSESNHSKFASKLGLDEVFQRENEDEVSFQSISLIRPDYALYPYQQEMSSNVFKMLKSGSNRVVIHLPTGAGKTRTAMNIASEHLRASKSNVVLWLADREELCQQAFSEFQRAWQALGNRPTTLYGFYSESDQSLGGIDSGFVVGGLHKFLSLRKTDQRQLKLLYKELSKSVTLVIFDEAHKTVADKFKQVVEDFISEDDFKADLIGLTATPGRSYSSDGLSEQDKQLAEFYNNTKCSMRISGYISPIDYLVENGYLAKAFFKPLIYDHSSIVAREISDAGGRETMNALASNVERNKKIIQTIIEECELGSQIIVFACTVEHGRNLSTALAYHGIKAASIDSKFDSAESRRIKIQRYKQNKLQVLVNFNVLTAGFDAPKTNVSVIAKPMNSLVQYLQMAGRAMRGSKSGGNKECRIYTVMDEIPEFQSISIAYEYWNQMWAEE